MKWDAIFDRFLPASVTHALCVHSVCFFVCSQWKSTHLFKTFSLSSARILSRGFCRCAPPKRPASNLKSRRNSRMHRRASQTMFASTRWTAAITSISRHTRRCPRNPWNHRVSSSCGHSKELHVAPRASRTTLNGGKNVYQPPHAPVFPQSMKSWSFIIFRTFERFACGSSSKSDNFGRR